MLKRDELSSPTSAWSKARGDERVFVLLARDASAPETIRFWADRRVASGENTPQDPQILEALDCAARMDAERLRRAALEGCRDGCVYPEGQRCRWADRCRFPIRCRP